MSSRSKLIDQGGFGCIFYPAIECDGSIDTSNKSNTSNKYVSKLVKKDKESIREYNISKIVKKINLYEYYYAPVINMCKINLAKIDKRERDMCRIIRKDKPNSESNFVIMKIPYIKNISMDSYLTHPGFEKKEILMYLFYLYEFLLKSLNILNSAGIVHFDFKIPNILIEEKTKTPIIIDFGLSLLISDIRPENYETYFYAYNPTYWVWSIDIHVICYLVNINNILSMDALINLVDKHIKMSPLPKMFSDKFIAKFKELSLQTYKKYVGMSGELVIKELIKNCNTWDNYALSVMFLNIISFISSSGYTDSKFTIGLSKLLLLNFHPDGNKRLSFDETKKRYDALFSANETILDYKKMLFNFNSNKFNDRIIKETIQQEKLTPVEVIK